MHLIQEILHAPKFRVFCYDHKDAGKSEIIEVERSDILALFYEDWIGVALNAGKGRILEALTEEERMAKCIQDWVVINSAYPVKENII